MTAPSHTMSARNPIVSCVRDTKGQTALYITHDISQDAGLDMMASKIAIPDNQKWPFNVDEKPCNLNTIAYTFSGKKYVLVSQQKMIRNTSMRGHAIIYTAIIEEYDQGSNYKLCHFLDNLFIPSNGGGSFTLARGSNSSTQWYRGFLLFREANESRLYFVEPHESKGNKSWKPAPINNEVAYNPKLLPSGLLVATHLCCNGIYETKTTTNVSDLSSYKKTQTSFCAPYFIKPRNGNVNPQENAGLEIEVLPENRHVDVDGAVTFQVKDGSNGKIFYCVKGNDALCGMNLTPGFNYSFECPDVFGIFGTNSETMELELLPNKQMHLPQFSTYTFTALPETSRLKPDTSYIVESAEHSTIAARIDSDHMLVVQSDFITKMFKLKKDHQRNIENNIMNSEIDGPADNLKEFKESGTVRNIMKVQSAFFIHMLKNIDLKFIHTVWKLIIGVSLVKVNTLQTSCLYSKTYMEFHPHNRYFDTANHEMCLVHLYEHAEKHTCTCAGTNVDTNRAGSVFAGNCILKQSHSILGNVPVDGDTYITEAVTSLRPDIFI